MKTKKFIIFSYIFIVFFIVFFPKTGLLAQPFYCIAKRDVNIPYEYQNFKAKLSANSPYEIRLTIEEAYEGKELEIKFITGGTVGDFGVDGKALLYYLGNDAYNLTNPVYMILGPEGAESTDIPIPAIYGLFMNAKLEDEVSWSGYDWDQYIWDANARIKKITISTNNVKIKYIEFLNDFGEPHPDSQYFSDYSNFDETGWENLTLTTGESFISTDDEILFLRTLQAQTSFDPFFSYSPYGYPFSYSYYPYGVPQSSLPMWGYPGGYQNFYSTLYTPHFPSGWNFASYLNTQSRNFYPYYAPSYGNYTSSYRPYSSSFISGLFNPFGSFGTNSYIGGFFGLYRPFYTGGYSGVFSFYSF